MDIATTAYGEGMEEFQEADVLWPADAAHHHNACHRHRDATQPHAAARREQTRLQSSEPVRIPVMPPPEARGYGDDDGVVVRMVSSGAEAGTIVPPHVLAARRCAEERRMASSVCVGHGRTLKGRDLRAVRNAVLHMTGFLSGSDKY